MRHAAHDGRAEGGAGQAGAARIEQPHDVAFGNAACGGVLGVQRAHLPALPLLRHAVRAKVQLAMQPGSGLIGHQEQGVVRRGRVFGRQPRRVARAVRVAKAGDHLGTDLHLAARRGQGLAGRVVAERAQDAAVVVLLG
ncbi:hypothetical protein D3C72_1592610 [compost metagenome]